MADHKRLARKAAKLLASLGDTPEEMAAMLLGAGYKGVPIDPYECPCGACLRDHLGVVISVGSDHLGVVISVGSFVGPKAMGSWAGVPLPPVVEQFISRFDAGQFPALIRNKP